MYLLCIWGELLPLPLTRETLPAGSFLALSLLCSLRPCYCFVNKQPSEPETFYSEITSIPGLKGDSKGRFIFALKLHKFLKRWQSEETLSLHFRARDLIAGQLVAARNPCEERLCKYTVKEQFHHR